MKRNKHIRKVAYIIGTFAVSATFAVCGGGAAAKGDATPLVSTVDGMIFEYQLAKSEPATEDTRPLGNTKWRLESVAPRPEQVRDTMVFEFRSDGNLVETSHGQGWINKTRYLPLPYRRFHPGHQQAGYRCQRTLQTRWKFIDHGLRASTACFLRRANDIR